MADPLLPTAYFNGPITDSGEEFDPELLAEFQREIERHEKALILVKQREQEAILARQRAAQSQIVVEAMKTKCDTMKDKLDLSKQTLREATIRAETKDKVCETINSLKTRAEGLLDRHQIQLNKKSEAAAAIRSLAENKIQIDCEKGESNQRPDIQQTALDLQEKLAKSGAKQTLIEVKSEDSTTEQSFPSETEEESEEVSADFTDMVSRLEAKCATVREGLGQMAVSEQYMRTKQAQLLAKRKEKEMLEAELRAAQNEREAQAMRRKVEEMAKLLAARKTKLKAIESSIDKKADVVEKVEKMIGRKERVAQYFEKQKFQALAFEKNLPNDSK